MSVKLIAMDPSASASRHHPPNAVRDLLLTIVGSVAVLVLAVLFFIFVFSLKFDPIPSRIRSQVSYPIYWVSTFPPGFQPTIQGYTIAAGKAVQLILQNSSHHTITISQLAAPSGYNPLIDYNQAVTPLTTSPLGIIYNLSFQSSYHYAIDTGHTMIMITSITTGVPPARAKQIADGLRPAH